MIRNLFFWIFFILTAYCQNLYSSESWSALARRFTGESDFIRQRSVQQLKKIPHLESLLKNELQGPSKFLALDVISTLKLQALLPELMAQSEHDTSGFFYNAMNSFIQAENQDQMTQFYFRRLTRPHTSAAAKVVILDTLGRLQFEIPKLSLRSLLFKDSSPEVRSAALYYLRGLFLKEKGSAKELSWLENMLETEPFQLRLQALYLLTELPERYRTLWPPFLKKCRTDSNPEVAHFCNQLSLKVNR